MTTRCLPTLRENEIRPIKVCVGRILFYNTTQKVLLLEKFFVF